MGGWVKGRSEAICDGSTATVLPRKQMAETPAMTKLAQARIAGVSPIKTIRPHSVILQIEIKISARGWLGLYEP